jgi:hypothetical protein
MNVNRRVRLDQFFANGGTVEEIERLAEDSYSGPTSIDDLTLDWALDKAECLTEQLAAQYVRRDGSLAYLVPLADKLALVSSDGNVMLAPNDGQGATRATLSPEGIRRYRRNERVDLSDVIGRIRELLVRHVRFGEEWQPDLIALWVVGTFLHSIFALFGYLHITSPSKRCGKSLLLDLLTHLCFNATHSSTDPSPAFIFRDAERNYGTQLFDEVERLTEVDQKRNATLMAMLNSGFKRGARVPRIVDAKTNSFHEFNVYTPRVLAGIRNLSNTLADRSFRIEIIRKPPDERLERFSPRRQRRELIRLRDDLHIAALQYATVISDAYDRAEEFPILDAADDRLRDIMEPLFAIAAAADANARDENHIRLIAEATKALVDVRVEYNSDDDALVVALKVLEAIVQRYGRDIVISSRGAQSLLRKTKQLAWIDSAAKARTLLNQLGFRSGVHRLARFTHADRFSSLNETARGYEIKTEIICDLLALYSH